MADRKKIVLNNFYNNFCIEDQQDVFGLNSFKEPYQPDFTILDIYEDYDDEYRFIFACAHDKLNKLLDFMIYKKRGNGHYNADSSRELISLIDGIFELQRELEKTGVLIVVEKEYLNWMFNCLGFLKGSGGSQIPEDFSIPPLIKFDPIFAIQGSIDEKRLANKKVPFTNEYQRKQAAELLRFVKTDTTRAVGASKEYIESCLQSILDGKISQDVDKADLTTLMTEARKYFKLNSSENEEINKIIKGLSQVVNGLCELRNHKGSGHSHKRYPEPTECEAQLAVDAAIMLVNFYSNLNQKKQ